ncbi:MAG: MBL fold metallo-hydrolase [Bacteroidetes bacterium]|nr:MBL fold metallo-hydrolase [Bacteroidota bacterium]
MLHVQVFTFNPFSENTYILYNDSGEAALFDPGCFNAHEQAMVKSFLEDKNLKLQSLFLTHAHIDHILGYHWVNSTYNLVAHANEKEEPIFKRGLESSLLFGIPYTEGPALIGDLQHKDEIIICGEKVELREAPGHSPGSLLFVLHNQKEVLVGDVIFEESIGRTDLPGGNHETLLASISKEVYSLPDDYVLHPGHGRATTVGHEKRFNPFVR